MRGIAALSLRKLCDSRYFFAVISFFGGHLWCRRCCGVWPTAPASPSHPVVADHAWQGILAPCFDTAHYSQSWPAWLVRAHRPASLRRRVL
jgi:hypothetical protein